MFVCIPVHGCLGCLSYLPTSYIASVLCTFIPYILRYTQTCGLQSSVSYSGSFGKGSVALLLDLNSELAMMEVLLYARQSRVPLVAAIS